jgi:sirohydrochlorin cobaltochelatase
MADAVILFAHGARESEWAEPLQKIQQMVERTLPEKAVVLAFLEIMQPSLSEAVATVSQQGAKDIRIVPLFLAQGGHLKHDLPRLVDKIRRQHPHLSISVSKAIGEVDSLLENIARWAAAETE